MDFTEILHAFTADTLDQEHRPILRRWGSDRKLLEQVLVVQRLDVTEGLCTGIEGHLTCMSTRPDLPPNTFLGLPVSVQLVTDTGGLQAINGIVTDVRATDGEAAQGFLAEVSRNAGSANGETDGAGKLAPISSEQFEKLVVNFFVSKT